MKLFITLASIVLLTACRSTRPIQTAINKKDTAVNSVATSKRDSAVFIQNTLQQLNNNRINFKTLSAKVNVDYRSGDGKNYDVNALVRMQRDSAIWISVNAVLGIEAMRVLITKDSVKLIDKLNKTYMARSVDYLQEVTSLPLNLSILQDLLVGNPVFVDNNILSYSQTATTISLLSLGEHFKNLISVDAANKTIQASRLNDIDPARIRTADLGYSDYENKGNRLFATKRRITVSEKKKLDIKLDFKQYDFDGEVSFPFTLPKNFKSN